MSINLNFITTAFAVSLFSAPVMLPGTSHASSVALVTNNNDSGAGSLRHAIEVKKSQTIIIPKWVSDIEISNTLNYDSTQKLTIKGHGQTVQTGLNITMLAITQGADLKISNLNFTGPGNFSISQRGDQGVQAGKGIFIDVRDDQTGRVNLILNNVSVAGVANHGIHVSDCSLADDCGAGSGGGGEGSPASIMVKFNRVSINDVGNGKFDADGLRVDDRGEGGITFYAHKSSFTHVGADGVELDEGNEGDVYAKVSYSNFSHNGGYCDPDLLEAFLPAPKKAKFAESEEVSEFDIPPAVSGSPDDSCFEREVDTYNSGFIEAYKFGIDLDDGIDIDEAGEGSLLTSMKHSIISFNLDEGVDFDEEDEGMIWSRYVRTEAFSNNDDGYKHSEEGAGSVIGQVNKSSAMDNGGKGFVFEEENEGDLFVSVSRSTTGSNGDSDQTGIEVVQQDEGQGKLKVRASDIADGIDTDGVSKI